MELQSKMLKTINAEIEQADRHIRDGNINELEAFVWANQTIKRLTEIMEVYKSTAIDEAEKYGTGEQKVFGLTIIVKNTAATWDYSNVPGWESKDKELKALTEKARNLAQLNGPGHRFIDPDSGEELIAASIKKVGGRTISISKSKS